MRFVAWFLILSGIGFSGFTVVFAFVGADQEIHAVHNVVVTSLIVVLTVPALVVVARAPETSAPELLILAALTVAGVVAMALSLTPDPFILPVLVLIGVLWFLAPSHTGSVPAGSPSLPVLAFAIGAALLLGPYALDNAALQRSDTTSDHARFFHWVEVAFYSFGIVVLAALGAWRPRGFRLATWCAGIALTMLGAASAVFPGFASALAAPWSGVALVGGPAFIGLGERQARRSSR
jgi:hypothetical protein